MHRILLIFNMLRIIFTNEKRLEKIGTSLEVQLKQKV